MIAFDQIALWISYLPIYFANGLLAIMYWMIDQLPMLVSLGGGCGIAFLLDQEVQQRVGYIPGREGLPQQTVFMPRSAQIMTMIVGLLWLAAQWNMAAPVPWIGAMMWVCGLVILLAMPAHRFNLLWYVKAGIAIYALCVIGSRIYLHYTLAIPATEWSGILGNATYAEYFIQNTQRNVTSILVWLLWLVVPLGYFVMLVQQLFVNPMSLVHPFATVQEMIHQLRDRKGGMI